MFFAPFKNGAELFPIINLLKLKIFNGRTCNNHTVVFLFADFVKSLIEFKHMLRRGVLRFVGCNLKKLNFNLKRRITQQTKNLRFCFDFSGHKIEQNDFQRSDILLDGSFFRHNKNIFRFKSLVGRKLIGNFDRHFRYSVIFFRILFLLF
mgnify:CR=1 FL=1